MSKLAAGTTIASNRWRVLTEQSTCVALAPIKT